MIEKIFTSKTIGIIAILIFVVLAAMVVIMNHRISEITEPQVSITVHPEPGKKLTNNEQASLIAYTIMDLNDWNNIWIIDQFDKAISRDEKRASEVMARYRISYNKGSLALGYGTKPVMADTSQNEK